MICRPTLPHCIGLCVGRLAKNVNMVLVFDAERRAFCLRQLRLLF